MDVDEEYSTVAKCYDEDTLPAGHAVMFGVMPKFLNVDIKVYINIYYGGEISVCRLLKTIVLSLIIYFVNFFICFIFYRLYR